MIILGIETSCDETAAAILQKDQQRITILSNIVASSAALQAKYGGVIPEQAAREQIKAIIPVIEESINDAQLTIAEIDAIAITQGPGLIGSLLVGVETAKTLSQVWQKPLIPVNHLIGHFYANWITNHLPGGVAPAAHPAGAIPQFPCIGLLVSGGHTDLVLFKNHGKYQYLGGTRDDAAGECFDKCARILGLAYPGGPEIARLAENGNPKAFNLPRPMIDTDDFDFSYSGLKTAVANLIHTSEVKKSDYTSEVKCNLSAAIEAAIVDPLVKKTIKAAKQFKVNQIIVAGGVAANDKLRSELQLSAKRYSLNAEIFVPQKFLCTDNAAMIAAAAFFQKATKDLLALQANPNFSLAY